MKQEIIGFHQDDEGDWVAELACGHTRHVRHNPPWMSRPWVTTVQGRRKFIGVSIDCKTCDEERGASSATAVDHDGGKKGPGDREISARHVTRFT